MKQNTKETVTDINEKEKRRQICRLVPCTKEFESMGSTVQE